MAVWGGTRVLGVVGEGSLCFSLLYGVCGGHRKAPPPPLQRRPHPNSWDVGIGRLSCPGTWASVTCHGQRGCELKDLERGRLFAI